SSSRFANTRTLPLEWTLSARSYSLKVRRTRDGTLVRFSLPEASHTITAPSHATPSTASRVVAGPVSVRQRAAGHRRSSGRSGDSADARQDQGDGCRPAGLPRDVSSFFLSRQRRSARWIFDRPLRADRRSDAGVAEATRAQSRLGARDARRSYRQADQGHHRPRVWVD